MKFSELSKEEEKQYDSRYDFVDKIVKPKTSRTPWVFNHFKNVLKQ